MEIEVTDGKTFIVTLPDKTKKEVKGVYSFWIDTDPKTLYLRDGNGEIIAVFNEWLCFEKEEMTDEAREIIFDEFGYIVTGKLTSLTHEEVQKIINDEIGKTKEAIKEKKEELKPLKSYLSVLEYNSRTVWLSYQDDRPSERKVLG